MAYTTRELGQEFWMLTKGILQDSNVDTDEARVILRWLEEHRVDESFDPLIAKLQAFLKDGYIDRFESTQMINSMGNILRRLRSSAV